MTYRIFQDGVVGQMIVRSDNAWIPADPANTDYAAYLEWVAAGNTPEPWQPDPDQPT